MRTRSFQLPVYVDGEEQPYKACVTFNATPEGRTVSVAIRGNIMSFDYLEFVRALVDDCAQPEVIVHPDIPYRLGTWSVFRGLKMSGVFGKEPKSSAEAAQAL